MSTKLYSILQNVTEKIRVQAEHNHLNLQCLRNPSYDTYVKALRIGMVLFSLYNVIIIALIIAVNPTDSHVHA